MPNSGSRRGRVASAAGRTAAACAAACLALGLAACTAPARASETDDVDVLATFTVLADMAQVVAGPDLRVASLTDVGTEIHGYEPTPDDLRRAAGAELLLANGLGLEADRKSVV